MKPATTAIRLLLTLAIIALPFRGVAASTDSSEFTQAELDQTMAPVALYPDSLLAQILMAATYPTQVAEAAEWSKSNPDQKGDAAVEAVQDKGWDPSVASLAAFPQVLEMMGGKPDWVKTMGDAFLATPEKVMDTVQALRKKAKDEGNLETTKQQTVIVETPAPEQTIIKIEPADPQVIYVPSYNPTVVYGSWWWPSYPPYYYPPRPYYGFGSAIVAGIGFGIGIGIVNSIWGGFNWGRHDVNINVNRYNNININNRINVNKKNTSWKHNAKNRKGVPYRDSNSQKRFSQKLGGADKRDNFRGRDADRANARSTLKNKGMDPAKERKNLRGSGGEQVRSQVNKTNRDQGTRNLGDRNREQNGTTGKLQNRNKTGGNMQNNRADRSGAATPKRSNNALSGIGDGGRKSNLGSQRGASSNRSLQRNRSGGRPAGGHAAGGRAAGGARARR